MSRWLGMVRGLAVVVALVGVSRISGAQEPTGRGAQDRRFEEFVRKTAGGMVADVAVETEHVMKVKVKDSVSPEDVLPLTKNLMAGARKDFPDEFISVAVYDPAGKPILRARFRPGKGVDYEVVPSKGREGHEFSKSPGAEGREPAAAPAPTASTTERPASKTGRTERDVKFAKWAEEKGHDFLRYVEADLEEHGRIWFGVTKAVAPKDVPSLTKSLLEGAHNEFPRKDLTAVVFDPEGERIGTATLGSDGSVHWDH